MNVVFLGHIDWANTSNSISRAINRVGGEMSARVVTLEAHPYGYPEDVVISDGETEIAHELVRSADWVIRAGDMPYDEFDAMLAEFGARGRVGVRHDGPQYRGNPDECDRRDRAYERRFVTPSLYRFVKHDPQAFVHIQPQDRIAERVQPHEGVVRVCHTPSDRSRKGTKQIGWAMQPKYLGETRGQYSYHVFDNLPFDECYERRSKCHVYIDQLDPDNGGGYGAAAAEAMARGLAVISDTRNVDPAVSDQLPDPPIVQVRSQEDVSRAVVELVRDRGYLQEQRQKSLAWAQKYLSDSFTYTHWKECLA